MKQLFPLFLLLSSCSDSIGRINLFTDSGADRHDAPDDLQGMVGPGTCPSGSRPTADAGCTCVDNLTSCQENGRMVCVDVRTDTLHCGRCGFTCGRGWICPDGRCICPILIRSAICNGVCVHDLWTSDEHCGACGNPCRAPMRCFQGVCGAMLQIDRSSTPTDGGGITWAK